jgi:hypothetical protein
LLFAAVATLSPNLAAIAQTTVGSPGVNAPPQLSMSSQPNLSASQRAAIARDLVAKWQSAADRRPGGGGARWARLLTSAVMAADGQNVLTATSARSVDDVHLALTGGNIAIAQPATGHGIGNGKVAPQVFGSNVGDLVYTPLPNGRCRIADSRNINSPVVGTRNLHIDGLSSYASQGGTGTYSSGPGAAECGINNFTRAYAMSVTLLSSAAAGIFKVFEYGEAYQTGNSITMTPGTFSGSADLIVTSCQGCSFEIGINSSSSVHYVIDIVGYYMPPQRTPLTCTTTGLVTSGLGNGFNGAFFAPACPSNYTRVSIDCHADRSGVTLTPWGNDCLAYNFSGATANISRAARCCSVPGR